MLAPAQVEVALGTGALTKPGTYGNVNALAVSGVALLLVIVTVPTVVPPTVIDVGARTKVMVGAISAVTVSVALLATALLPLDALKPPAGKVKTRPPALALLTLTPIAQVPVGPIARPLAVSVVLPAAELTVPPQELTTLGGVAVTTPAGYVNVNAPADKTAAPGLVILSTNPTAFPTVVVGLDSESATVGGSAAGATTRVTLWVALGNVPLAACMVKLNEPAAVGVPLSMPLVALSVRPAGTLAVMIVQVIGVVPEAVKVLL